MRAWFRARLSKPSPGTVMAFAALMIVLGGTAVAATTTIVNIADPTTPANKAKVDATGKLAVGDGTGPLTVDGTVTAQQAPLTSAYHQLTIGLDSDVDCVTIAVPPAGKALVVKQFRLNVYADPSPGANQVAIFYNGVNCDSGIIADVSPPTVGHFVIPFDPGFGSRTGLSVSVSGDVRGEVYVDAYTVPQGSVPAASAAKQPVAVAGQR